MPVPTCPDPDPLLRVSGARLRFGGVTALDDVHLAVRQDSICALIGPNGAGKTTLFNCISGLYRADEGSFRFQGRELADEPPHAIAALGIARTFQNLALIPSLTILENIMLGAYSTGPVGFATSIAARRRVARRERDTRRRALDALDMLGLAAQANKLPDELPFGSLKRVELGRALLARPKLLLLDEPACGLNHDEVERLSALIVRLQREHGPSVLVVEHNMNLVRAVAGHAYVLDAGRVISEGTVATVSADPRVVDAYLGTVS
jgi:branched-chain amino acid transport system ATP-binding protein